MVRTIRVLGLVIVLLSLADTPSGAQTDPWERAAANGELARTALLRSWRFAQGWLQNADPVSGLIPRNLTQSFYWNAQDSAADNYPFMVLTSYLTDRALFDGRMKQILASEQRLCNRLGRLPDDWLFETQSFRVPEVKIDALVFGAAEYAKDGLLPLTEFLGPSPWSDRMLGMLDDIWTHGAKPTEVGPVPATSHEVAGDLLQSLSRMYWMTGDDRLKERAFQIGDYFLIHHLPTEAEFLQLDDHGCEVVNGLSEAYYLAFHKDPARHRRWQPRMHRMLDRILEVGRDANGLLFSKVNPKTGARLTDDMTDNWGYNYNAFLVVAALDGVPRYRDAVEFVLSRLLQPEVRDYMWEGGGSDGYADSLEGGLNLLNRVPVAEGFVWADLMAAKMFSKQRDTGVIEGWHGDGNFARTAIMWAMWKSQGAHAEPWRADLRLGSAKDDRGNWYFTLSTDWPWKGRVCFDTPRHREHLKMPSDYPRLNQFPEWFTVAAGTRYDSDAGIVTAETLRSGVPVSVAPSKPWRLRLKPGTTGTHQ